MITHGTLQPLELAHLPYGKGRTYEDYLGKSALRKRGKKKWREKIFEIVPALRAAFQVDYAVLGGGNELAFEGGFRMWDPASHIRFD